jgi:hypothetical protein
MSRAFVREDAGDDRPGRTWNLPQRDDPDYDRASAETLLEGARIGETTGAEEATGYRWGEPALRPYVERMLQWAREAGDERLEQVAERFLRA